MTVSIFPATQGRRKETGKNLGEKALSRHWTGTTTENHEKSVRIAQGSGLTSALGPCRIQTVSTALPLHQN